jgi:hypothetical protein
MICAADDNRWVCGQPEIKNKFILLLISYLKRNLAG